MEATPAVSKYGCSNALSDQFIDRFKYLVEKRKVLHDGKFTKGQVRDWAVSFYLKISGTKDSDYCPFPDYLVMYCNGQIGAKK